MSTHRVPTRLSIVRNLERWVVWPLASAGGAVGAVAIGVLFHGNSGGAFSHLPPGVAFPLVVMGTVTAALTAGALRLALRAKSPRSVALATLGSCALFAVINSPLCFLAVTVPAMGEGGDTILTILSAALFAAVVGLPFSLPLGCLWGLAFVGPMMVIARLRLRPTLDGPDRALLTVGGTLAIIGGLGALAGLAFEITPHVCGLIAAVGAGASLVAAVRLRLFSRFLSRVRLGLEDGWAVVSPAGLAEIPEGLPRTDAQDDSDHVLVRLVSPANEGAYRSGGVMRIPWAFTSG